MFPDIVCGHKLINKVHLPANQLNVVILHNKIVTIILHNFHLTLCHFAIGLQL